MPEPSLAGTASAHLGTRPPWPAPARPPRAFLDLGAVLTSPGCARAWTRVILCEWGAAELADVAELVASELVRESVTASAELNRAVIRLALTLDQGELAILVRDDHPGVPMAAQRDEDDEDGRGLVIVEQLSDRCGWYPLDGARAAKVTWAVISEPAATGGELPAVRHPGGLPGAGRPVRVLPDRHRQTSPLGTGMRAHRPVDPAILARVKAALERL